MIYHDKEEFLAVGTEIIQPSADATLTTCKICLQPLDMTSATPSSSNGALNNNNTTTTTANGSSSASSIDNHGQGHIHQSTSNGISNNNTSVHRAIRIFTCTHVHGEECLTAWLETGNTCPTCGRILFFPHAGQRISQADINSVIQRLSPIVGEEPLYRWVAKYMEEGSEQEARRTMASQRQVGAESTRALDIRTRETELESAVAVEDSWVDDENDYDED